MATLHRLLLEHFTKDPNLGVEMIGSIGLNRPPGVDSPSGVKFFDPPVEGRLRLEWYEQLLGDTSPDVLLFFHVLHNWALWHVRLSTSVPAVGSIQSWTKLKRADREQVAKDRARLDEILPAFHTAIFPSWFTLNEGHSLGLRPCSRELVIHNPVQPVFPAGYTAENAPPDEATRSGILFVGSLIPLKRPEMVLHAAAALGVRATFAGTGELEARLKSKAQDLGMDGAVQFLGDLSPAEVAAQMRRHELLCGPSASEAFGNVYVEALASGMPVVGFAPTLREIAAATSLDIGIGVSADADQAAVTAAVESVMARQWDRNELAARSATVFDAGRIARRYAEVLRDAADTARR